MLEICIWTKINRKTWTWKKIPIHYINDAAANWPITTSNNYIRTEQIWHCSLQGDPVSYTEVNKTDTLEATTGKSQQMPDPCDNP